MVKRYKRRRRRRRRRNKTGKLIIRKTPIPQSLVVNLRYYDVVQVNPGIGAPGVYVYRANSIFDPDFTGVGHQPMGMDEWGQFYKRYTVLSSKISCVFVNVADSGNGMTCAIGLRNTSTAATSPSAPYERPSTVYKTVGTSTGKGLCRLNYGYSATKFYGIKNPGGQPNVSANLSANPAGDLTAYYHLIVSPLDTLVDLAEMEIAVTITYRVMLHSQEQLFQS